MVHKDIELKSKRILSNLDVNQISDLNLDYICHKHNINLVYQELKDGLSGMILFKNNLPHIICNSLDSEKRQRFTIAHELGHFFMHMDKLKSNNSIFIETNKVLYRDENSSKESIQQEIEANNFAAALIMPKDFILDEIKNLKRSYLVDDDIENLAETFKVSIQAMSIRLSNLGYII